MGWRPRLVLNENKRSTWARLGGHVSPGGGRGAVGALPEPGTTLRDSAGAVTEDFPRDSQLLPRAPSAPAPSAPRCVRFPGACGTGGRVKRQRGRPLPEVRDAAAARVDTWGLSANCPEAPNPPQLFRTARLPVLCSFLTRESPLGSGKLWGSEEQEQPALPVPPYVPVVSLAIPCPSGVPLQSCSGQKA